MSSLSYRSTTYSLKGGTGQSDMKIYDPTTAVDLETIKRTKKYYLDDDVYLEKMQDILTGPPHLGVPAEPTQLVGHVFVGTQANAENLLMLKRYHITAVLNCSEVPPVFSTLKTRSNPYPSESGVQDYFQLNASDSEYYTIVRDFGQAHSFMDGVKIGNGRVLVHCTGTNRSGAIALAYLIRYGQTLLEATKMLKELRRTALNNSGFMKQLVTYSRSRSLLDPDVNQFKTLGYMCPQDMRRIRALHLPEELRGKWYY